MVNLMMAHSPITFALMFLQKQSTIIQLLIWVTFASHGSTILLRMMHRPSMATPYQPLALTVRLAVIVPPTMLDGAVVIMWVVGMLLGLALLLHLCLEAIFQTPANVVGNSLQMSI
jgi:hypothetical protein